MLDRSDKSNDSDEIGDINIKQFKFSSGILARLIAISAGDCPQATQEIVVIGPQGGPRRSQSLQSKQ